MKNKTCFSYSVNYRVYSHKDVHRTNKSQFMNMRQYLIWALFCFVFFSCQVNTSQYLSLGAVKILIFVANTEKSESIER